MSSRMDALLLRQYPPGSPEHAAVLSRLAPPKDASRVAAGHKAVAFGAGWEAWLTEQHAAAHAAGIAFLRHVGPPHRRTGKGGTVIKIVGNGPADFQGAIRPEDPHVPWWRVLAVEAKSLTGRLQRDDLAPHQRDDLAWAESVGGVGLVVVELHDERGVSLGSWAIPWGVLETRWHRSARTVKGRRIESASAGPKELEGWEVGAGIYLERFAGGEGR